MQPQAFQSNESYILLLIFKQEESSHFTGFPHSLYDIVESMNNLTPRGLETVFSCDDCLDTFLLSKRQDKPQEIHYMLFLWNGKSASPLVKAVCLTKGFELDNHLLKGKEQILLPLFLGAFAKGRKIQRGSLASMDCTYSENLSVNRKPNTPVYLLQWLWPELPAPSPPSKPLFQRFQQHFLSSPITPEQERSLFVEIRDELPVKLKVPLIEKKLPGFNKLNLAILKTREEQKIKFDHLTKDNVETINENFDIRDTDRQILKNQLYAKECSELYPGLYVGGDKVAKDIEILRKNGITHIINCAGNACGNYFPEHFTYMTLFLKDSKQESIDCIFYQTIDFIEDARMKGGRVYVHCYQGVSRSVTVCLSYIIFKERQPFEEVLKKASQVRAIVQPNFGFEIQLKIWFKRLFESFDSVGFDQRVYAITSHTEEQPQRVVPRMFQNELFEDSLTFLDPRGLFIIHTQKSLYLWEGCEIHPPNIDRYFEVAHYYIKKLQTYEQAPQLIHIKQYQEPAGFWKEFSFDERPEESYGFYDREKHWYARLEVALDQLPKEYYGETEEDTEEIIEEKPRLYIYPDYESIGVFDDDELIQEGLVCLCSVDKMYSWIGMDFEEEEIRVEEYVKNVMDQHYGRSVPVIEQLQDRENEEFLRFF